MLIPLSWLKEYVDIKMPFPQLAARLNEAGLTVEKWEEKDRDIIFDPEVTPNRSDWMSIYGIAREITVVTNAKPYKEEGEGLEGEGLSSLRTVLNKESPKITVRTNYKIVPRITSVIIRNVKVKPSPEWLQKRIKQIGLRPINNLVDITNYVLWLHGNPLHIFDYDKIRGKTMSVELSRGGEAFRSLDGMDYTLPKDAIIIKDLGRVIDLPPIKGGENTAVSSETKTVLLHSIVCDPVLTRRASQVLGLRSDSSAISERGVDPNGTILALNKALELIIELAEGEPASEILDYKEKDFNSWTVTMGHEKLEKVLGIQIEPEKVKKIFEGLKLNTTYKTNKIYTVYTVEIPTFRNDLHIEEDLIEEVGRIYGYNNFPKTLPAGSVPTTPVAYKYDFDFDHQIKQTLKGAGYSEIYTYSLISQNQLTKLSIDLTKTLRIDNPISQEYEYLRPTLLGNLLDAYKLNQAVFSEIRLYEFGKEYRRGDHDKTQEIYWLDGILSGEKFSEAKGTVEQILQFIGIKYGIIPPRTNDLTNSLHPGRAAVIVSEKYLIGFLGEMHPNILNRFGLKGRVTAWGINIDLAKKLPKNSRAYQPVPKYPPVIEDLSLLTPEGVLIGDIVETIRNSSKLVSKVELIDTHENSKTFRLTYLDPTKNLTEKEAAEVRAKILKNLRSQGARSAALRG